MLTCCYLVNARYHGSQYFNLCLSAFVESIPDTVVLSSVQFYQ